MLQLIFSLFEPDRKVTWLSARFSRWRSAKYEARNAIHRKKANDSLFFDVAGAGEIEISKSCFHHTGRSFGFEFGVSWGRHGFIGGVLDREKAKKLAEFILSEYDKVTDEQKLAEQNRLKERDQFLAKIRE